jgi:2-C-methyl-D-erythritol 2,4-cyclodiphosphate synthase
LNAPHVKQTRFPYLLEEKEAGQVILAPSDHRVVFLFAAITGVALRRFPSVVIKTFFIDDHKKVVGDMTRVGLGYDVHRLVPGRKLILGGITIPFDKGLLVHSDADVLLHAACDALLGAAAMGDIGEHFPDTDPQYKDACSLDLLATVYQRVKDRGLTLVNLDATVFAQAPKLVPYKRQMVMRMAGCLDVGHQRINIKATTTEGLGAIGQGAGIAAMCVVLLKSTIP